MLSIPLLKRSMLLSAPVINIERMAPIALKKWLLNSGLGHVICLLKCALLEKRVCMVG